jgi:glycosyltransferase involved in cell wall biosynthesis
MLISILIPCRNEEKYIERCIQSVLGFSLPDGVSTEIYFIDGCSTDQTRSIILESCKGVSRLNLLDNPGIIQASALNIGIRHTRGDFILRLDAHSQYPKDYLIKIIETQNRINVENVGGIFITQPGNNSYSAAVVQAITTHPFGVGNAGFRTGAGEGLADTVPYGFYKRSIFEKIGFFDERLVRAQDYEFNRRIIKSGGRIWRNPSIQVYYYNQTSFFKFLRKQIKFEAPYNAYMWYLASYTFAFRHMITGVFTVGIIGGLILSPFYDWIKWMFLIVVQLYFFLALFSAMHQARRYRYIFHVITLPLCFFLYHFLHGFGVLYGLFSILTRTSPVQKKKEPWPGAGRFRAWPVK